MLIQISSILTILYVLNSYSVIDFRISNGWVLGGFMLFIYFLNDRYFKGRFTEFEKKWKNEEKSRKVLSGFFLFFMSLSFLLNIFFIANKFHKLP
jgi:hypothetical protein